MLLLTRSYHALTYRFLALWGHLAAQVLLLVVVPEVPSLVGRRAACQSISIFLLAERPLQLNLLVGLYLLLLNKLLEALVARGIGSLVTNLLLEFGVVYCVGERCGFYVNGASQLVLSASSVKQVVG